MMYRIKAHPTRYAGIEFRSRLEATWAAFFDQLGWHWDYEPIDLQGWVPDFIVRGSYRDVLIEIKPTREMADGAIAKATKAAPDACIGFLADGLQDDRAGMIHSQIGHIVTPYTKGCAVPWRLRVSERLKSCDCHIDGERYIGFSTADDLADEANEYSPFVDLRELWAEASNKTRWRPQ